MDHTITPTTGERIFIARRRLGQTQLQRAQHFGVSLPVYCAWERDEGEPPKRVLPRFSKLAAYEACVLLRRRAGKLQREVAKKLKCSRFHLNKMERGLAPCEDLLAYWMK